RPTVTRSDASVQLFAWYRFPAKDVAWRADVGRIDGAGRKATWNLASVSAGTYRATVAVTAETGEAQRCSVEIVVLPEGTKAGDATGGQYLLSGKREAGGY